MKNSNWNPHIAWFEPALFNAWRYINDHNTLEEKSFLTLMHEKTEELSLYSLSIVLYRIPSLNSNERILKYWEWENGGIIEAEELLFAIYDSL